MTNPSPDSAIRLRLDELIALRQQLQQRQRHQAQSRAAGFGSHRSHHRGRGMAFAEVRAYQPGDDIRTLDWRVTARTGKPHTKLFDEERERPVLVALDYRRPMFFATRGRFKAVQASQLAALIGWQALLQGDRFGAFFFSEQRTLELRPQLGKHAVLEVLRQMVEDPVWQRQRHQLHQPFAPQQRLEQTLLKLHRVARPGSLIILISDFAQWDSGVEKQLSLLARHSELHLVFCSDPFEAGRIETAVGSPLYLSDGATRQTLTLAAIQAQRQGFAVHQHRLEQFCQQRHCQLLPFATTDAAQDLLPRLFGTQGGRR